MPGAEGGLINEDESGTLLNDDLEESLEDSSVLQDLGSDGCLGPELRLLPGVPEVLAQNS